jgi:hypothetical protein
VLPKEHNEFFLNTTVLIELFAQPMPTAIVFIFPTCCASEENENNKNP